MSTEYLKYGFLLIWFYFLMEVSIRFFLVVYYEVPFFSPAHIIYHYYPQVKRIEKQYKKASPQSHKILVLSSSALTDEWGRFQENLQNSLDSMLEKRRTEVFNASGVGFSSYDNLNTFRLLQHLSFDEIIFYNGINDMRFNNCPAEVYKSDYTHAYWNNEISCILRHEELSFTVVPFFFDFVYQSLRQQLKTSTFLPDHYTVRPEWLKYGGDYRSLEDFTRFLNKILEETDCNTRIHLFTFAYFIPGNYSLQGFNQRTVDYNFHANSREIENWGSPENVAGFLEATYPVLDSLAKYYSYPFYPVHKKMQQSKYFADVCHYAPVGMRFFSTQIAYELASAIKAEEKKH